MMATDARQWIMTVGTSDRAIARGIEDIAEVSRMSVSDVVEGMLADNIFGMGGMARHEVRCLYAHDGHTVRNALATAIIDLIRAGAPEAAGPLADFLAVVARAHGARLQGHLMNSARCGLHLGIDEIRERLRPVSGQEPSEVRPINRVLERCRLAAASLDDIGVYEATAALELVADFWDVLDRGEAAMTLVSAVVSMPPWDETALDRVLLSDAINEAWSRVEDRASTSVTGTIERGGEDGR